MTIQFPGPGSWRASQLRCAASPKPYSPAPRRWREELKLDGFRARVILACVTFGAMSVCLPIAPAVSAARCSNDVFDNAASAALAQREEAIGEAYVGNYASAAADAFIGWRTLIKVPAPCLSRMRNVRTHLVRNLGALWLSYTAMAAGDSTGGLSLLVAASKEAAQVSAGLGPGAGRRAPLA